MRLEWRSQDQGAMRRIANHRSGIVAHIRRYEGGCFIAARDFLIHFFKMRQIMRFPYLVEAGRKELHEFGLATIFDEFEFRKTRDHFAKTLLGAVIATGAVARTFDA